MINEKDLELLKLDNQLCFALYATSKKIINYYKPILDKYNLTYTQYITLLALWEKDDVTVKELGNRLYLDSGTLTPLLKKLEIQGLITRLRDSVDERNVYIRLTEIGKALQTVAPEIPKQMICSINSPLEDVVELHEMLKTFLNKLE